MAVFLGFGVWLHWGGQNFFFLLGGIMLGVLVCLVLSYPSPFFFFWWGVCVSVETFVLKDGGGRGRPPRRWLLVGRLCFRLSPVTVFGILQP